MGSSPLNFLHACVSNMFPIHMNSTCMCFGPWCKLKTIVGPNKFGGVRRMRHQISQNNCKVDVWWHWNLVLRELGDKCMSIRASFNHEHSMPLENQGERDRHRDQWVYSNSELSMLIFTLVVCEMMYMHMPIIWWHSMH